MEERITEAVAKLDVTYFLLAVVLSVLGAGAFTIDQLVGL